MGMQFWILKLILELRDPLKTLVQKDLSSEGEDKEALQDCRCREGLAPSASTPVVPKYLIVKRKEGDFKKVNPFLIEKFVTACAGSTVTDFRKTAGRGICRSRSEPTSNGQDCSC